jgi:hypothetical protein
MAPKPMSTQEYDPTLQSLVQNTGTNPTGHSKTVSRRRKCYIEWSRRWRQNANHVVDIPTIDCCLHQVVLNIVTLRMKFNLV